VPLDCEGDRALSSESWDSLSLRLVRPFDLSTVLRLYGWMG
jgi:hypothetical protein